MCVRGGGSFTTTLNDGTFMTQSGCSACAPEDGKHLQHLAHQGPEVSSVSWGTVDSAVGEGESRGGTKSH